MALIHPCSFLRPQQLNTIDLADLHPEIFQRRYRNTRPLLIRNAVTAETLARFADAAYMADQIREQEGVMVGSTVKVMVSRDDTNFMDNELFVENIDVEVNALATSVIDPPEPHKMASQRLYYRGHLSSSLLQDISIPTLIHALSPVSANPSIIINPSLVRLWVSHAGSTTPLHYDRCHGLLVQLCGRKRFVVLSHEETRALYPYNGVGGPTHASRLRGLGRCFADPDGGPEDAVEARAQDLMTRWGKVARTEPWVIDLGPGDALYTPVGFWHEVTSLTGSVSVTVPWDMNEAEIKELPAHMAF